MFHKKHILIHEIISHIPEKNTKLTQNTDKNMRATADHLRPPPLTGASSARFGFEDDVRTEFR